MIKIVFFGTPDYVVPLLDLLPFSIEAVVTQPPKPAGRNKKLAYSSVDKWAEKKEVKIIYDLTTLKNLESRLAILAAYGQIIPEKVIDQFPLGIINIHPSLLPKWRGASPIQASLTAGETITGVSIMKLDSLMDHGPILGQFKEKIKEDDTTETLRKRSFKKSASFLIDLLPKYIEGKIKPKDQDHKKATYTKIIKKEDGFIPPNYLDACLQGQSLEDSWNIKFISNFTVHPTPDTMHNFIRAMDPWPFAWTFVKTSPEAKEKRLKILKASVEEKRLVLKKVQLEGKTKVSWEEFKSGYPKAKL